MRLYHHGTRFLPYKGTANDIEISSKNDGTKWGNMHPKKMIVVEVITNGNRQRNTREKVMPTSLKSIWFWLLSWSSLKNTFKYWKCNHLSSQLIFNASIFVNVNKVQSLERPRKHLPQRQRWHLGRSRANWSSTFMQGLICNRCQGMMPPCSIFLDPCEQQNRHFRNRLKVSTHN